MSALPPKADQSAGVEYIRFVPEADIGEIIRARKRKTVLGRLSKIQTLPAPAEQSYRI